MNQPILKIVEPGKTQPVVVSQTGNGDFKSISCAIEEVEPGATIYIKSGFYEESLNVSKPLSLVGDPNGLVVITNSNFALLTVHSTELKLAHVALASGLRLPSVELVDSIVHFDDSILWALDPFLKNSKPSLLPARALVDESFLGESMRNAIGIGAVIADLLGFSNRVPGGSSPKPSAYTPLNVLRRERDNRLRQAEMERAPFVGVSSPDVLARNGSELNFSDSFIGMANFVAREHSVTAFAGCRLDYATFSTSEKSRATFSGCAILGEENGARESGVVAELGSPNAGKRPTRDPVKREREAVLLQRVKEMVARRLAGGEDAEAQTA